MFRRRTYSSNHYYNEPRWNTHSCSVRNCCVDGGWNTSCHGSRCPVSRSVTTSGARSYRYNMESS